MTADISPQFLIGIDLGTTNCALSYAPIPQPEESLTIHPLPIPQLTEPGTEEASLSLPSFLYRQLQEEQEGGKLGVSWDSGRSDCVGVYARKRGEEVPDRLVASAKSWLSHTEVDRRSPLLPEGASREERMSPVEVCAQYLSHLKEAWDQAHPESPFLDQDISITVPASFDPSARDLSIESAKMAGFPEVTWLEEPQAAFYAWLHKNAESWREQVAVGDRVLVVDVGGGTTDFSLIEVSEVEGDLVLERVAVGDHLLLGGDNMDLAAAYLASQQFEDAGHVLDEWQFKSLVHLARTAKESLLSDNGPESVEITLQGRGSSLIGGSLSTSLERDALLALLVDGFFPIVPMDEPLQTSQAGLQAQGLPYANDPRVSSQLAAFLSKHDTVPQHLLFNGGVFRADALRHRLLEQLNQWASAKELEAVVDLPLADFDGAVSQGAVYYASARRGGAVRIRGGTSRSYFIGVEDAMPAVPGLPRRMEAVCVVPFGMEEGTEEALEGRTFALLLGQQATFRFFSCSTPTLPDGSSPEVGTALRQWKAWLTELSPVEATLEAHEGSVATVSVSLRSHVNELGVLELWCETEEGQKWKLEFNVRDQLPQKVS